MLRGIAIETSFVSPTNFRGARVKAECYRGKIVVPFDHELGKAHENAAITLIQKLWPDRNMKITNYADSPSGKGFVFLATFPE